MASRRGSRSLTPRLDLRLVTDMVSALPAGQFTAALRACDPALAQAAAEVHRDPRAVLRLDERSAAAAVTALHDPSVIATVMRLDKRENVSMAAWQHPRADAAAIPVGLGRLRTFDDAAALTDPVDAIVDYLTANNHLNVADLCSWLAAASADTLAAVDTVALLERVDAWDIAADHRAALVRFAFSERAPSPPPWSFASGCAFESMILAEALRPARGLPFTPVTATMLTCAQTRPVFAATLWNHLAAVVVASTESGQPADPLSPSAHQLLTVCADRTLDPARLVAGTLDASGVTELLTVRGFDPDLVLSLCRTAASVSSAAPAILGLFNASPPPAHLEWADITVFAQVPDVTSAARLQLLACSDPGDIVRWLGSSGPAAPRPGEAAQLVDVMLGQSGTTAQPAAVVADLWSATTSVLSDPTSATREFVDAALARAPRVVPLIHVPGTDTRVVGLILAAIGQRCGDDEMLWSTMLTLSRDWQGSFEELCCTAAAL